jgi:hypothetical protein
MAINYSDTVKAARLTAVLTALNAGSGPGQLRIYTAAYATLLVSIDLDETDDDVDDTVLALLADPSSAEAVASGTAAIARLTDSDGNVVAQGLTVGTSGADVVVDSTNVTSGQQFTVNSAVITHAA